MSPPPMLAPGRILSAEWAERRVPTLGNKFQELEAVMDRDIVCGLAEHKTDQCNDMEIGESLR